MKKVTANVASERTLGITSFRTVNRAMQRFAATINVNKPGIRSLSATRMLKGDDGYQTDLDADKTGDIAERIDALEQEITSSYTMTSSDEGAETCEGQKAKVKKVQGKILNLREQANTKDNALMTAIGELENHENDVINLSRIIVNISVKIQNFETNEENLTNAGNLTAGARSTLARLQNEEREKQNDRFLAQAKVESRRRYIQQLNDQLERKS